MKTVIVTGVNGQLSQYLVKYLQENEPDVQIIGTVRHKSYDKQEYIFNRDLVTFELMDLSDVHSIENLIIKYRPDYFLNFAANAIVSESFNLPAQQVEVNLLAVIHQLEAIRKHSPLTKYFTCGTSEEFAYTNNKLNEESKISPHSIYGVMKNASRGITDIYRKAYNIYAIQNWLFNFESKIRGEKYLTRKVTTNVARIYHAIKAGKAFEPLKIGNMYSCRSWQHAADVAEVVWRTLNQEDYRQFPIAGFKNLDKAKQYFISNLHSYVISSGNIYSVKDFITKAFEAAGITGTWEGEGINEKFYINDSSDLILVEIDEKFFRPLDVKLLHGDAAKAKRELDWEAKISFDEIVQEMVDCDITNYGK